jgi:hypothetical protein
MSIQINKMENMHELASRATRAQHFCTAYPDERIKCGSVNAKQQCVGALGAQRDGARLALQQCDFADGHALQVGACRVDETDTLAKSGHSCTEICGLR